MTQEKRTEEQITGLAVIVPLIQKQIETQAGTVNKIWEWISGNGKEGAGAILRRHEAFIQECIEEKKTRKRLVAEKVAYLLAGGVLVILTRLFTLIWG